MDSTKKIKQGTVKFSLLIYLFSTFLIKNSMLNMNSLLSALANSFESIFILACLIFAIFFNRYTNKELISLLFFSIPLLITMIVVGSSPLLNLLIILVGIKSVPLKEILQIFLFSQIISSLIILFLRFTNVIPDRTVIRDGVSRLSLGFWHPNNAGLVLLSIFLLTLFLYQEDKIKIIIGFNILNVIFFQFTNSRTSFLLIISATMLTFISNLLKDKRFNVLRSRYFIPVFFTLFLLGSYMLSELYSSGNLFAIKLSSLMSNRISLASGFIDEYGLSVFGTEIYYRTSNLLTQKVIGFEYRVLDNVYLKYLLNYGITTVIAIVAYFSLIPSKMNKKYLIIWNTYFIIFIIYGFIEQSAFNLITNYFMIFGVLILEPELNREFVEII